MREFGLKIQDRGDNGPDRGPPKSLGVWDGEEFRFTQDLGGYYWWNIAKLLWQYGFAPVRTHRLMKRTVGTFLQLYDEPYFPFRSLSKTARDLNLMDVTSVTGDVFLRQNGVLPPFSMDIIQASTRVNYAQNLAEIHGLETMVCMATDGAMAVQGGNWQIFDGMLRAAGAHLVLNTSVTEVARLYNGSFLVHAVPGTSTHEFRGRLTDQYDSVIIATPLQFADLKLPSSLKRIPDEISYVKLHVTLFTSPHRLSPMMFNLGPNSAVPDIILTTLPTNSDIKADQVNNTPSGFFSVSTLRSIQNPSCSPPRTEYLYKIFSPEPAEASLIYRLLGLPNTESTLNAISKDDVSWLYEKSWHSYPFLTPRANFEDVQVDWDLWYTSGIESFISTMETSSLMGMNVARLMVDDWGRQMSAEMRQ